MTNKMNSALYQAAVLTFEELGFLLPTPTVDEYQREAKVAAVVGVEFRGPFSGRLVLRICGELLPTIAANMLGQDEPPDETLQQDALRELTNVICGNALPLIAGRQEVFRLSPPHLVSATFGPCDGASPLPLAEAHIGLEQGCADVLLFVSSDWTQGGQER